MSEGPLTCPVHIILGRNSWAYRVQQALAMSNIRFENSTSPVHLVTPQRVVVPMPKPFDAPPGVVPFHRMLRAENISNPTKIQHTIPIEFRRQVADTFEPAIASSQLSPKLGEVLPVAPIATAPVQVHETRQVQLPATGRLLDIYL